MYLERLLQITTAALAALATLLLGMGERSVLLPLGILLVAMTSVWVTDVTGWFRLNRPVTNVAAFVAVLLGLWEVVSLRSTVQIFAIANLLIYLQVILLFQEKQIRTYWQLIALSLLQAVIAAAFNQGALFGVLLAVYLATCLSAMALLFLHRERLVYARPAAPTMPDTTGRWPLAGQTPAFSSVAASPSGRRVLGRNGGSGSFAWSGTPRLRWSSSSRCRGWAARPARPGRGRDPHGGLSDKVRLGELGQAIENRQGSVGIEFRTMPESPTRSKGIFISAGP